MLEDMKRYQSRLRGEKELKTVEKIGISGGKRGKKKTADATIANSAKTNG